MKLLLALFCSIVIVSFKAAAQDVLNADSLRADLRISKADTNRVKLLIQLGQQYEANEPDSALAIYSRALKLSESIQYTRGIISYYTNATYVYNILGKHDTSLLLNLRSVEVAKKLGDPERLATCLANVGASYLRLSEYEKAVDYTLQAVTWAERSNDLRKLSVLYSNLSNIYRELRQYPLADSYGTKALTIARSEKNPYQISAALVSLAIVKSFSNRVNEAIPLLNEAA
ncbi:MAG: tetratricopeptide repeat protein, partial [Cyclobacteriaceae bacterium]|nr:tetratricopeptide repeat protein [Cyclobacteriaceae bacterium]